MFRVKKIVLFNLLFLLSFSSFANTERWDENKKDWSPLMLAIYYGKTKEFTKLIDSGADVNFVVQRKDSNWRLTALEVALRKNNETAVDALLRTNRILGPEAFLMVACGQNSLANVEQLIRYGANPKDTLENGYSVTMMATSFGSYEILETLLRKGADVKQTRKVDGMNALMLGAFNGQLEKVKLLIAYGADKTVRDKNGNTALYYAENIYDRLKISNAVKENLKQILR